MPYREEDAAVEAQYGDLGENNTYGIGHDGHDIGLDEASRVGDKDDVSALAKTNTYPAHDGEGRQWHQSRENQCIVKAERWLASFAGPDSQSDEDVSQSQACSIGCYEARS